MKNQYFGDVNDYRKYGVLRILGRGLQLGICWMLTPSDGRRDGRIIQYLRNPQKWKAYDPQLFELLHRAVELERNVEQARRLNILPGATYWGANQTDYADNRTEYFGAMSKRFSEVDLVFLDPDNGLEVKSVPLGRKDSPKYLYWHELEMVFKRGRSAIIYQHFPHEKREPYIKRMKSEIENRLHPSRVFAFRTPRVVFLLAAQKRHLRHFSLQIDELRSAWPEKQIRPS